MADPHKPPSRKEVRDSGAADWVEQAMEKHEAKQAKLGSIFGETQKEMRMEKDALAGVWSKAAEEQEADKGPDIFAAERSKGAAEKKKLASVWDQDRAEREAEEAQLRNMFGGGGSSGGGGGKKKR